jgi:cytochrome b
MAAGFRYDAGTRLIHLLLAIFVIAALASGEFAGDYRRAVHTGFDIHRWTGIAAALALALRLVWGIAGPAAVRFVRWLPVTLSRLRVCAQDLAGLARLRLPVHEGHAGLSALVQALGLAVFAWMAVTGSILWFNLTPGARAVGWLHTVKELHEGGEPLAIAYLVAHVGAVLVHSAAGHPVWRRIALWGAP